MEGENVKIGDKYPTCPGLDPKNYQFVSEPQTIRLDTFGCR